MTTTPVRPPARLPRPGLLTLDDLADRCGLHPELVRRFWELGLIEAAERVQAPAFAPETLVRVRRVVRLRRDLGVNYAGVGLVLDLLERVEELEARLRRLGHPLG